MYPSTLEIISALAILIVVGRLAFKLLAAFLKEDHSEFIDDD